MRARSTQVAAQTQQHDPAQQILEILSQHRRLPEDEQKSVGVDHYSDKVWNTLTAMIEKGEKIRFVVPSFPKKAPVRGKTLGDKPDMAELISLRHLNQICVDIAAIYPAGAEMVIYSDGFAFDSVFPEDEVYSKSKRIAYLVDLNKMFKAKGLSHLTLMDLDGAVDLDQYAEPEEVFHARLKAPITQTDKDNLVLFKGLMKFRVEELKLAYPALGSNQRKKLADKLAKGVARYSAALSDYLNIIEPDALRLSCHPKTADSSKIGIWFNADHSPGGTPWHNAALLNINPATGKCVSVFKNSRLIAEEGHRLQTDNDGNPSHFVCESVYQKACLIQRFFKKAHARNKLQALRREAHFADDIPVHQGEPAPLVDWEHDYRLPPVYAAQNSLFRPVTPLVETAVENTPLAVRLDGG